MLFTFPGLGYRMCIEDKALVLAKSLRESVLSTVDNIDDARAMVGEYVRTRDSQVSRLAELCFAKRNRLGIKEQLHSMEDCRGAKLSLLRETIKLVLEEYIDEEQAKFDATLPHFVTPQVALV